MLAIRQGSSTPDPPSRAARRSAGPILLAALLLTDLALAPSTGCSALGRRGPVSDEVAASRSLSRQGVAALEMQQWDEAERLLRKAIEASPADPEPRRHLAEALWRRGAADEALLHIEAAVRLDRADAGLAVRAGEMLLAVGSTEAAYEHAEKAISRDPRLASAWALRGRIHWQLQDSERALADMQRSLQFSPNNADVLLDVAALYRQRGQPTRCLTTLHYLLETYTPGEEPQLALLLEGLTLSELGRPEQAVESLAAASRRGPPNAEVYFYLAQAQLAAGSYSAATATAHQALAIDASHQPSRQLLVQLAGHAPPQGTSLR